MKKVISLLGFFALPALVLLGAYPAGAAAPASLLTEIRAAFAPGAAADPRVAPRAAQATTDVLLLPYFEVDLGNPKGTTTLFAVRNETESAVAIRVLYLSPVGPEAVTVDEIRLAGHAVHTVNLRDVKGLRAGADGFVRGLVVLGVLDDSRGTDILSGDFFTVLPGEGTAGGGNLINLSIDDPGNELCSDWSTRFLAGGEFHGATTLTVVADVAGGDGAEDPPTLSGVAYDEAGQRVGSFSVKTASNSFRLDVTRLLPADTPFGSLALRFQGTRGVILAEHSAERFHVGLKATCTEGIGRP